MQNSDDWWPLNCERIAHNIQWNKVFKIVAPCHRESPKPRWQHLSSKPSRDFHWPAVRSSMPGSWCRLNLNQQPAPSGSSQTAGRWQPVTASGGHSQQQPPLSIPLTLTKPSLCSNSQLWIHIFVALQDFLRQTCCCKHRLFIKHTNTHLFCKTVH